MFPPFPTELAKKYCQILIQFLDSKKCLNFNKGICQEDILGTNQINSNCTNNYSTDYVFCPGQGQMFGVLVCKNINEKIVILKAFSGQYNSKWIIPGWVPPLLDVDLYNQVVSTYDKSIKNLTNKINSFTKEDSILKELQQKRKELSRQALKEIYNLYQFHCADGKILGFREILKGFENENEMPPTGTGDCCTTKLLSYAFQNQLIPLSLCEFFYGSPTASKKRSHKSFYPPCDEKCSIVLPFMLGLKIEYQDEHIVVVDKPANLLSVPGRGEDKQDCIVNRLKTLFPNCIVQPSVHRLDMDTSGLLVLALTEKAHRFLSEQFMNGTVYKEYEALLRGKPCGKAAFDNEKKSINYGTIKLPFRLDIENRPYQIYDKEKGKMGITDWFFMEYKKCPKEICHEKVLTRIKFIPKTGRTHQLRLHSMHPEGLGIPIQGDRLYGSRLEGERMMLHATKLKFIHPETLELLTFKSPSPF